MDTEEQEHLVKCKRAAEHIADATEQLVFEMLVQGGVTADTISPSLGLGVFVGPAYMIAFAKTAVLAATGLDTVQEGVTWHTSPRADPDEPCRN